MGYENMFGESYIAPNNDEQKSVTPLSAETVDMTGLEPLCFRGFASPLPLLIERPSRYLKRVTAAAESMIKPPDGEDVASRIFFSPAVALPFFILQGNELLANEMVTKYPLLHTPQNHEPDADTNPNVYALTLVALYESLGLIHEDSEGNLLAYPIEGTFTVSEEHWTAAADWAKDVAVPLANLNKARLLGFALADQNKEMQPLSLLFDSWDENRLASDIIAAGKDAAEFLEVEYNTFLDTAFKPFAER